MFSYSTKFSYIKLKQLFVFDYLYLYIIGKVDNTYRELYPGDTRFSFVLGLMFGFILLICFVEFAILTAGIILFLWA